MTTTKPHVIIDGTPVAPGTAYWFGPAAAEFKAQTGLDVLFSTPVTFQGKQYPFGGLRSTADQTMLYDAYKAGTYPYLVGSPTDPTVSRHLDTVGAAIDVRDSGADAGIDAAGSDRHNLWTTITAKYGFRWTGATFSPQEAWHFELVDHDPWTIPAIPAAPAAPAKKGSSKMDALVLLSVPQSNPASGVNWYVQNLADHTYYYVGSAAQVTYLTNLGIRVLSGKQSPAVLTGFRQIDAK